MSPGHVWSRLVSRSSTFGSLLLGCLLAEVATAQPWWRATSGGSSVTFTGTEATGGLSQALALVALAGTLLVLVLKVSGRRVVAVLLMTAGAALVLTGALRARPSPNAVETKLAQVSLIDQYGLTPTLWPWVFAVSGLVVVLGAVALVAGAPHWPVGTARFERDQSGPAAPADDDSAGIWRALDAGVDPTDPDDSSDTPEPADPNVQIGDPGDTMVANSRTDQSHPDSRLSGRNESDGRSASGRPTPTPE